MVAPYYPRPGHKVEPLTPEAMSALREVYTSQHRRLEWAHYSLRALWDDGPAEIPDEPKHDLMLRHAFHVRRWRVEGPGMESQISRTWPEVSCTLYEAERLAEAYERAWIAGNEAKVAEVRATLGL